MLVRFNDLPLPVRERFVPLTHAGTRDPRVLLHDRATPLGWFKYVTAVGALVAMVPILQFTIRRGQNIDPFHDREVYLGFAAAITVFLLSASAILFRFVWKPPPFQEGTFVLASYLVKASGGDLHVTSIAELGTPTIVTVRRNGSYSHTRLDLGGPFSFTYSSDDAARTAWASVARAREAFRAMLAARDAAAIAAVDPFVECTVSGAWSYPNQPPVGPRATSVPGGLKIARWVGAVLIGVFTAGAYYVAIDVVFAESRAELDRAQQKRLKRR